MLDKALNRLADSRRALHAVLDGLSESEVEQTRVEDGWTIKDLLGHIVAWEAIFLEPLRQFVAGGEFRATVVPDHDAWNAEQSTLRRDRSLAHIRAEMASVRDELVAAARSLTAEQLIPRFVQPWGASETLAQAIDGLAWHEEEHTRSILNWRATR